MSIKGLDNFVTLHHESHTYTDGNGCKYMSVSKFLDRFCKPFDRENISRMSGAKRGISQQEILAEWDKTKDDAIDHGNRIHNALESYEKTTFILPEDQDLKPMILSVATEYSHYYRIYQEQVLYNSQIYVAGTSDKILVCTSHPSSVIDIDDYKTNLSKGIQYKNKTNQYMLHCLSHLQDCNFNKYALQLSFYAWLLQQQTGRKIGTLGIRFIPPHDPLAHYRIPVPYMKHEIEEMVNWHMENPEVEILPKESYSLPFSNGEF